MKVSYNWLKNYLDFNKTPEDLAAILTDTGLEVEGLEKVEAVKGGLKDVVIGEVLTCDKHPDADRLQVTTVDLGAEKAQIVCGAPNVEKGQKVVVAKVGSVLYPHPDKPFKIKKAKIRGVESAGMICAEDEIGIGVSHDGIMVLDDTAKVGTPAADFFDLQDDYQIEIGLTPNRCDAMGHIGVARDIMAYLNVHENAQILLKSPSVDAFKVDHTKNTIQVDVEDTRKAPRYAGITVSNISVKPSPDWLKNALLSIGLTPINNIVDVTNYVLHELGTPLHAFDVENLNGRIVVKNAKEGEKFKTLDEVERVLTADDLMITNGNENLCLAGVFGGLHSGVKESTKAVFLEAAFFDPVSIRTSAKHHGLNTDASFRFERGIDPDLVLYALKRAALLIKEVAGGEISMNPVDLYPHEMEPKSVTFSLNKCNQLIGNDLSKELVISILNNLDITVIKDNDDELILSIPNYRGDVTREADVVEEVLRIYGFNRIQLPEKLNLSLSNKKENKAAKAKELISDLLISNGFYEVMNNSLTNDAWVNKFGGEAVKSENDVRLLNPLSNELDVMRQSLLFQLLDTFAYNQNRQHGDAKLFEFGKTYHQYGENYNETNHLIIGLSGKLHPEQWNNSSSSASFYTIKGIAQTVIDKLGLGKHIKFKPLKKSLFADGVQVYLLKHKIGEIGWVGNKLKKAFGLKNDIYIADFDWDQLMQSLVMNKVTYSELPKTFAVRRDFSLLLDDKITYGEIVELAQKVDKKFLKEINLFDVYEGDKLPEGKKSYAVSFTFQDEEKTLKDQQVDQVMDRIHEKLSTELNATLR